MTYARILPETAKIELDVAFPSKKSNVRRAEKGLGFLVQTLINEGYERNDVLHYKNSCQYLKVKMPHSEKPMKNMLGDEEPLMSVQVYVEASDTFFPERIRLELKYNGPLSRKQTFDHVYEELRRRFE